eukprot:3417436-Ditylum_brightwellii.AAC.1
MQCCRCGFVWLTSAVTVDVVEAASSLLLGTEEGKPSCDVGDGAAYESGNSRKLAEWAVGGTVVINNYYFSPSKKEE